MIFDLSHTTKNGMPIYPGDPETALFPEKKFEPDGYRLTKLETGLHAGTHIDMPSHLAADARGFPHSLFLRHSEDLYA